MRYLLLATDYDGTLASHGRVSESTLAALKGVLSSGRKLVLVTGRHLTDLISIFVDLNIFHRVVAENGAILYRPDSREEKLLCEPPNRKRQRKHTVDRSSPQPAWSSKGTHARSMLNIATLVGTSLMFAG